MKKPPRFRRPYSRYRKLKIDAKLEADDLQAIWERVRAEGASETLCQELADEFGVSSASIRRIAAPEFPYVVDSLDDDESDEEDT